MYSKVSSIGLKGMEGYKVSVEVKAMAGMDSIIIVGLPDASVKESKERISSALHSLGGTRGQAPRPTIFLQLVKSQSAESETGIGEAPCFNLNIVSGFNFCEE